MSPPGRPKGEHRSAQHEGSQVPPLHNPGRRTWLLTASAGLTVGFFAGCSLPGIPKRPAPSAEDAQGWVRHAGGAYVFSCRAPRWARTSPPH